MKTLDIIVDGVVCGHTTEEGITVDTFILIKNWWPGWIPVAERLPEYDQDVLVYSKVEGRKVASRDIHEPEDSEWKDEYRANVFDVTHWMPLPNPPKA